MLIFTNPPLRSFSSSHFEYYISFQYGIDVPSASFIGPSAYFIGPPSCSSAHKPFPEVFRSPLPESPPYYLVPSPTYLLNTSSYHLFTTSPTYLLNTYVPPYYTNTTSLTRPPTLHSVTFLQCLLHYEI